MAAKLVHEIRNPLCSIELFSSMLEKELTTTAHKDLALGISAGIGSLNNILTNMLFFARPNKSALKPIRLDQVIAEAIRLLEPMMASRNVTIASTLVEHRLCGDAELLKQVIMNILINAVQAMPQGGRIEAAMEQGPEALSVRITDTGTGIARENLEKIFDPFFTTKDTGTGLGLVIASTIMQATGGYITATSEPGQGTTFSLHFPAGEPGLSEGAGERDMLTGAAPAALASAGAG
jgi:signal transduction histidine kinase